MRHTYATLRLMTGYNVIDVSKQLRHGSVKTTLDTYTHWIPGTKKAEVNELDLDIEPDRNGTSNGTEEPSKGV